MNERLAPSVRFVRSLEGDYYLLREAADMVGVSHRTLRNFIANDPEELGPSFFTFLGKIKIYLYTDSDIERIKKHIAEQKTVYSTGDEPMSPPKGRPAKWTAEERRDRQRKFSQIHYYKTQARKLANEGEQAKAEQALATMRQIQQELKRQDLAKTYGDE